MRLSVLEGSLAQVFLNWTTGSVLTGYMLHLGASANQLALVASVRGYAPPVAVEFARKLLFSEVRPTFADLEAHLKGKPPPGKPAH